MLGSAVVYFGLLVGLAGVISVAKPLRLVGIPSRRRALAVAGAGTAIVALGVVLPAPESRVSRPTTRLDEFAPAWQFREFHSTRVAASPARVYDAIRRVRADEILLFRTLTWIRRGGRRAAPGIMNAADRESIIDLATSTTFVRLADEFPNELVVGTIVGSPTRVREKPTAEFFRRAVPPGFAVATMNFRVLPDGPNRSFVSTETRVFASGRAARRRFAAYWRAIYPGSALIRRMWLRAIDRRATRPQTVMGAKS